MRLALLFLASLTTIRGTISFAPCSRGQDARGASLGALFPHTMKLSLSCRKISHFTKQQHAAALIPSRPLVLCYRFTPHKVPPATSGDHYLHRGSPLRE
jgi:hypothetical protein